MTPIPAKRSPCRPHPCSLEHRDVVHGYRAWYRSEHQAAEDATAGYATELADYWSTHERPTFRAYLLGVGRV